IFRKTPEQSETGFRDGLYDEPRFGLIKGKIARPNTTTQPAVRILCSFFFFQLAASHIKGLACL
ncbi:hypothetical protein BDZ94DRAFT_1277153, partial [Collybia nuda]